MHLGHAPWTLAPTATFREVVDDADLAESAHALVVRVGVPIDSLTQLALDVGENLANLWLPQEFLC